VPSKIPNPNSQNTFRITSSDQNRLRRTQSQKRSAEHKRGYMLNKEVCSGCLPSTTSSPKNSLSKISLCLEDFCSQFLPSHHMEQVELFKRSVGAALLWHAAHLLISLKTLLFYCPLFSLSFFFLFFHPYLYSRSINIIDFLLRFSFFKYKSILFFFFFVIVDNACVWGPLGPGV
jgi:hypothetical protein